MAAMLLVPLLLGGCGFFGFTQPALPAGTRECIGMDEATCAQVLDSMGGDGTRRPVAWRVRCTSTCGRDSGDVEATVVWSDGSNETSGMSWDTAGPVPTAAPIPDPTPAGSAKP